jgi:hypothetical protein
MNHYVAGICGLCAFLALTPASADRAAARLKQIQGTVMVNQGESYRAAPEGLGLKVGDRLMVMEGSSMVLVYADGCVAEFKENQIVAIEAVSTCEGGTATVQSTSPLYVDAMGSGGGGAAGGGVPPPNAAAFTFIGLGVGSGAAFSASFNDDQDTISAE